MLSFTACEKSSDGIPAAIPESRIYVFGDSDSIIDQSVILLDGEGRFQFTFSPISSYVGVGTYVIEGDTLTMTTDDGTYIYIFTVTEEGLVYDAEKSTGFTWFGKVEHGSLFKG